MRSLGRQQWVLGTAVALCLSCGGKSESHGEEAARLERVSSAEADRAIRAALPEGARLRELRANPAGSMDVEGRDTDWVAWAQDDVSRQRFGAWVKPDGRSIRVTLNQADYGECPAPDLVEVDSAFAVPDALERIDQLRLRQAEFVWSYYWQEVRCRAESAVFAPTGHLVQTTRRGPDWQHFIFAHYDDAGDLVALCGPCDSGLPENCVECAP